MLNCGREAEYSQCSMIIKTIGSQPREVVDRRRIGAVQDEHHLLGRQTRADKGRQGFFKCFFFFFFFFFELHRMGRVRLVLSMRAMLVVWRWMRVLVEGGEVFGVL